MSVLSEEDRAVVVEVARLFSDPKTCEPARVVSVRRLEEERQEHAPEGAEGKGEMERLGKLWKPKPGSASKAVATGVLKVGAAEIRVGIFKNDKREGAAGANDADFEILALTEKGAR